MKVVIIFLALCLLIISCVSDQQEVKKTENQPQSLTDAVNVLKHEKLFTCIPEKPVVEPGEKINLTVWAQSEFLSSIQYKWEPERGRILGSGPNVIWDFDMAVRGEEYEATARVKAADMDAELCSVRVRVRQQHRGAEGRSFLISGQTESKGYGAYSYILLARPAVEESRQRYLNVINSYLTLTCEITELSDYYLPEKLIIVYLPITTSPESGLSSRCGRAATKLAEWSLDHYDYPRARFLLEALEGEYNEGPYLVTTLEPLSDVTKYSGSFLLQDLSSISKSDPEITEQWVTTFLNLSAQEHRWSELNIKIIALRIRSIISIVGKEAFPQIEKALKRWISFKSEILD